MTSLNDGNIADWQGGIGTVQERNKYLLENGFYSDVEFLVGTGNYKDNGTEEKQLFKAHKFILATGSSIFAAQFHFDGSTFSGQDKNAPIEITDIKASAFKAMLNFIYSNDISLITKENFVGVYTAAKKYLLYALVQKCIEIGKIMFTWRNVFEMLKMAKLHEDTVLIDDCCEFINWKIDKLDLPIMSLDRKEMGELLARNSLQREELDIFWQLNNWAIKQCENEGIVKPNCDQKRAAMGDLLYLIRFPLIHEYDFINIIVPKCILSKEEIAALVLHYSRTADDEKKARHPLPFSAQRRGMKREQQIGGQEKIIEVWMRKYEILREKKNAQLY